MVAPQIEASPLFRVLLRRALLSALAVCLFWSPAQAQEHAPFQFTEIPGPFPVGLKVVEQYDTSRTYRRQTDDLGKAYQGERGRPIQTLIWYPAEKGTVKRMTLRDYVDLMATETTFGHPSKPLKMKEWLSALKPSLATELWAVRDAPLKTGRYPVIIYAAGAGGTSWENADLCEYLASQGYVVIAGPPMGAMTRIVTIDLAGIDAQARDISFLIGYAENLPNANVSEVAVAGMSWGGISNVFAAARDNRIRALVSLDGSARYFPGLVKQAPDVRPDRMTIPMLAFVQRNFSLEDNDRDLLPAQRDGVNVLNAWTHGDVFTIHMLGLTHGFFTTLFQRSEDYWSTLTLAPLDQGDYGREDASVSFGWVARYTWQFLDAYLKHDRAAMGFLMKTPPENRVPLHLMDMVFREAKGIPISFDSFRIEVGRQGFDHAADIYTGFRRQEPEIKFEQREMLNWADELATEDHLPEAITLLKLTVQMYPDSGQAYDSLGDVYQASGLSPLAIDSYTKALGIDLSDAAAQTKLKKLR